MNEKLGSLKPPGPEGRGLPKESNSKLVEVLLGDKASQAFIDARGGDRKTPPTGDTEDAVDLTKISPETITTQETEKSLEVWNFEGMVRWVEEELQEAEGINDPEAWVNEHCNFVDGKIVAKNKQWYLNGVTTLSKFPPVEGLQELYLNSLLSADGLTMPEGLYELSLGIKSADGLTLPEGLQKLWLDRLKSADGLALPEGLQMLSLDGLVNADGLTLPEGLKWLYLESLRNIDGIIAPDNMSGTHVVLSTNTPQSVRDFFKARQANITIQ